MLSDLQFAYLALDDLRPDPRNPRTHSKKQVAQIADSISELGFAGAILINPDRTIIAGHGLYRALKLLGLASVATITVTGLTQSRNHSGPHQWRISYMKLRRSPSVFFNHYGLDPGRRELFT